MEVIKTLACWVILEAAQQHELEHQQHCTILFTQTQMTSVGDVRREPFAFWNKYELTVTSREERQGKMRRRREELVRM